MSPLTTDAFKHVDFLWDDRTAAGLDDLDRLVYRSNLLGTDRRITNTGGGNTSSKLGGADPLDGTDVEVLWVKGSGGDLRTARRGNFASLHQRKLMDLQGLYARMPDPGPKTDAEDHMVECYRHCTFNLNPRPASIDTPLHAFIPARHVDHVHPDSVIAIAASRRGPELTAEIFGDSVAWVPWQRPGFDLGLQLQDLCRNRPHVTGAVLGHHGLICWADDGKACYQRTLELIETAALHIERHDRGTETFGGRRVEDLPEPRRREVLVQVLPWLRGQISAGRRLIATVQADPAILEFAGSADAPRLAELGTSCPDHFLRTKIKPMLVDWNPQGQDLAALREAIGVGLMRYRDDYERYYEQHRGPDSPAMRDPSPTVVLIPGVGMIAWGRSKSESRVTAEFYGCAVRVMRGAEAIDQYTALAPREAFDIEYWALEEAKLRRMPPEKELARHVVVVVGAGSGIGRAAARRLAVGGAHVVCADLDGATAQQAADELTERHGAGVGVAGSGISTCGPAVGLPVDVTDRAGIGTMLDQVVLAYGGLDDLVVTSGVYVPPDARGQIDEASWRHTFDVNVTGAYMVADQAREIWTQQGLTGSAVLVTSVNAVVPKTGSMAYDTSKAAANHLVRELAVLLAPTVRVNGLAPATVVEGSSMFPRDRVIASLARYGIELSPEEETGALRQRLADFYAARTLGKAPITPDDQAEAIFFLVSDRSRRTTGQIISVDGGLPEAFLR